MHGLGWTQFAAAGGLQHRVERRRNVFGVPNGRQVEGDDAVFGLAYSLSVMI
jgi:hypothetical protein